MKAKILLIMAFALMGWSNVFAYDSATAGTTYYLDGTEAYGLSDGTVAITKVYSDATTITFPATITEYGGAPDYEPLKTYKVSYVGHPDWTTATIYVGESGTQAIAGSSVSKVIISEGIESIGQASFSNWSQTTNLQEVELPSTLTTIGNYAFYYCEGLTSIACKATTAPTLGTDALMGSTSWDYIAANCVLKVPDGCTLIYAANSGGGLGAWTYYDQFYSKNKIHELTYPSITTAGWGTYYNDYGYVMPEGVEGYLINWTYNGSANLVKVYDPGDEVYAGLALLWKSTTDLATETWYTVEALSSGGNTAEWPTDGSSAYTNLLYGYQTAQTITAPWSSDNGFYYYKLANDENKGLGWYWGDDASVGGAFESAAHKAFLCVEKSSGTSVKSFIPLFGDDTTGIESIDNVQGTKNKVYNLSGRQIVNSKSSKGIVIQNGKKFINK